MKYKILIKKCEDAQRASRIAEEIARWSGTTADIVFKAITKKPVCIRKEAGEDEARKLKAQFGGIGADVELVKLGGEEAPVAAGARSDDDDDEDEPGRVLTDAEYAQRLKERADIFIVEKDKKLRNVELVALLLAIALGVWMTTMEFVDVATDFFEQLPEERTTKLVDDIDATMQEEEEEEEEEVPTEEKKLTPEKNQGKGGMTGGGGDPRARVTQEGVLGIVSGQVKGKSVQSADVFGEGGFATDIDAVLSGVGGLKSGGDGGVGRKGAAGIGYGQGVGSGFGGSGGGIDDLIGGLMGGGGGGLDLKKRGELKVTSPGFDRGGALTGGRSRASIQRVVMQNMAALRHAYNRRLREKPGLGGRVTVKFSIDEFGKVLMAQIEESTIGDSQLEQTIVARIRRWNFDRIDKPGDVTEVVYPFVFSQ
ncbi:AgmX/PglI C-terminal domain-containing protein [Chitinispirillales bacterium ANBcel5]|uniref:AgmX/PglI C-terminal domain-containing protein n=1 Tax=Cellulosispirillum alkaliphilum TaxID=3039283 RepID=UPI002A4E792D|nr:AgmX/PglI C-terminal domain-containing protein [Chitinispirillales bacterium ANBcel5]